VRSGQNELIVRVEDETEGWQLRGKQVLEARGIWYTQVSGIWQTVWLEQVAPALHPRPEDRHRCRRGHHHHPPDPRGRRRFTGFADRRSGTASKRSLSPKGPARPMTLDDPRCQTLVARSSASVRHRGPAVGRRGENLDLVASYAGIRTVGKIRDAEGHWRLTLNGEPIFHWGPLDQGWWPDGLLTPPSDEGMRFDIEFLKAAGFNMIRKHIKAEPRRYYYHCDRLGMMVWQDHVSGGLNPKWTRLLPNPQDATWPDEHHQQFMLELAADDRYPGEPSVDRRLGAVQRSLGPTPHHGSGPMGRPARSVPVGEYRQRRQLLAGRGHRRRSQLPAPRVSVRSGQGRPLR
jgi:hypothetical protein